MQAIKFYIALSVFILVFSCKPEELPPPQMESPVFSVSGSLLDITAGENDFYLFTDFEKDAQDVYKFIGRFAQTSDCTTDCNEELLIEIRDAQQTSGSGSVDIDNALQPGNYDFQVANPMVSNDLTTVQLTAEPDGTGPYSFAWNISYSVDTGMVSEAYFTEQVTLEFEDTANVLSPLNVCLNIFDSNSCQEQYCNEISLENNDPGCQANFDVLASPVLLSLKAEMINGSAPFTYLWSNGDTTDSVGIALNGPFAGTFCVTITDADNCTDAICKAIDIPQGASPIVCSSRFSYEKTIEPSIVDSLQLSTVFIQYTDVDGNVFRSDLDSQPNSGSFEILSVEDYETNENGDKTKKLRVSANCMLFNANLPPINFPFEGVIAVAYP